MNSLYSALLGALEDETEGVAPPEAELPTAKPVMEPGGVPATPTVAPTPEAPTASEPAPEAPARAKTIGEHLGVGMEDVTPPPRHENKLALISSISKAGSQLGGALSGTKADTSTADQLFKQGASDATSLDRAEDSHTDFKRQLLLRRLDERKAKGDPALDDENSPEWKAADSLYATDPRLKDQWAAYKADSRSKGLVPSVNLFQTNATSIRSNEGADSRGQYTQDQTNKRFWATQNYDQQKRAEEFTRRILATSFGADMDAFKLEAKSTLPKRGKMPNSPDNPEWATKVAAMDANTADVLDAAQELLRLVKANEGTLNPQNPLENEDIRVSHQTLLNRVRRAEEFGVPSGKDMEQLARQVVDPTAIIRIFKGQEVTSLNQLMKLMRSGSDAKAAEFGYSKWGTGGAAPDFDAKKNTVKEKLLRQGGGRAPGGSIPVAEPAPTTGPASAKPVQSGKTTPSGKPYAIQAKDKATGNVHYFDADGNEVL